MKPFILSILFIFVIYGEYVNPPTTFKSIKLTQSPSAGLKDTFLYIDSGKVKKGTAYVAPTISVLGNNHAVNYAGQTLTSDSVYWTLTGDPITSQTLTPVGALAIGLRGYKFTGSWTTDQTHTLAITDGKSPSSASTYVLFYIQGFYGTSADAAPTAGDVQAGTSSWVTQSAANRALSSTAITGGGNYIFYSYPNAWGTVQIYVNGFASTWIQTTISVTNAYGDTRNYYVYTSPNTIVGTINLSAVGN